VPPPESPEAVKERELDELRRFRVRTVPPDVRRHWLLGEMPHVATVELQDTEPPNRKILVGPRPVPPAVSMHAKTRKLPHIVLREERSKNFYLLTAVVLLVAAMLVMIIWRSVPSATPPAHVEAAAHSDRGRDTASIAEPPRAADDPIIEPAGTAREPSRAARESKATPTAEPVRVKEPSTKPHKQTPEKGSSETDIKAPLFGQ